MPCSHNLCLWQSYAFADIWRMSSIVLRAGGTRPAPPALAGAVHEATRSGAGMRMEEAQVKLRSSDCALFFHM